MGKMGPGFEEGKGHLRGFGGEDGVMAINVLDGEKLDGYLLRFFGRRLFRRVDLDAEKDIAIHCSGPLGNWRRWIRLFFSSAKSVSSSA